MFAARYATGVRMPLFSFRFWHSLFDDRRVCAAISQRLCCGHRARWADRDDSHHKSKRSSGRDDRHTCYWGFE
ncbi:protein of unknown function [Pararobbsia alpina]